MKRFGCGLGLVLLLLATAGALVEVGTLAESARGPISLGWLWFQIHGNSLVGFQALIEKNIGPAVWAPIQSLLTWRAWLVLGVPGVLLALCCLGLRRPGQAAR
jgi:hypothetical protein